MKKDLMICFIFLLPLSGKVYSQALNVSQPSENVSAIITDRPDQNNSPNLVPVGYFQVETGSIVEVNNKSWVRERNMSYSNNLFKFGVSKNVEFRLETEYVGNTVLTSKDTTNSRITGFSPISLGMKIAICEEKGLVPKLSLLTMLDLPYPGKSSFCPQFIAPRFRLLAAHTISPRISFSYNIGTEWDGNSPNATGVYSGSLGINVYKGLSMFVESYGFLREKSHPDHRFDSGFTYLVNNSLQLDLSWGLGITKNAPNYFISGGLSFRLRTKQS